MLSSKGLTLENLKDKKIIFKVPNTLILKYIEWKKNKKKVLEVILKTFKKKKLIIRSSAPDEDKDNFSNAGKYLSIANLYASEEKNLSKSINKIFKSYKIKKSKSELIIIIQEMITNVSMSGVLFTYDLDTGSPYFVINYDDVTGKTNTVTSGSNLYSNRKIFITNDGLVFIRSKRFKSLISATKNLQKFLGNNYLDIEFAIKKNFAPILFQVRNISSKKKWTNYSRSLFNKKLNLVRNEINFKIQKFRKHYKCYPVFGQMPDWNPVEMLGQNPKNLSISLYKKLITNKTWKIARKQMRYQCPTEDNLMEIFSNKTYINTSLSFESFLPKGLNKSLRNKLIQHWSEKLRNNVNLHDKIEFKICITCFSFDIKNKLNNLLPNEISKKNKNKISELYLRNFKSYFDKNNACNIDNIFKKISFLEKINLNQKRQTIDSLIKYCRDYGTLPFSVIARHAFISQSILNSLLYKKILTKKNISDFNSGLNTITRQFIKDMNEVARKKMKKIEFMNKYGHLRPGTYDIEFKKI